MILFIWKWIHVMVHSKYYKFKDVSNVISFKIFIDVAFYTQYQIKKITYWLWQRFSQFQVNWGISCFYIWEMRPVGGAIVGLKSTLHTSFQCLNYRWDINCIDQLRDYMKLCYKAVLDVFEEIEEKICKEGKLYVHYAKVAVWHY